MEYAWIGIVLILLGFILESRESPKVTPPSASVAITVSLDAIEER